jgi:hypothetical protein
MSQTTTSGYAYGNKIGDHNIFSSRNSQTKSSGAMANGKLSHRGKSFNVTSNSKRETNSRSRSPELHTQKDGTTLEGRHNPTHSYHF